MFFKEFEIKYNSVCEKIYQIFPHIENISIFYKDQNELKYLDNGRLSLISEILSCKIPALRNQNVNYQWLLPNEIIENYENDHSVFHQLDLLSEHDNRLLILNFKSEIDGLNDLVCLTFPKEIRFLGLYKTIKNLSTEDKILIGELLHKIIEVEIQTQKINAEKQLRISEYFKLKDASKKISVNEFSNYLEKEINQGINSLIYRNIDFEFESELIEYIIQSNIPIKITCQILKESFDIIELLEQIDDRFKFQLYHFKLIENQRNNLHKNNQKVNYGNDKVFELLDKLESAAKVIEANGLVVNGKLIAQYLTPPVSPPAITDILKKNSIKIESKMKEFPSKWTLIRKYLKPLREIEFKLQLAIYNKKIG